MKEKIYVLKRLKKGVKVKYRSRYKFTSFKKLQDLMMAMAWARFARLCQPFPYKSRHCVFVRL